MEPVTCPLCAGNGHSSTARNGCRGCQGRGKVAPEHARFLVRRLAAETRSQPTTATIGLLCDLQRTPIRRPRRKRAHPFVLRALSEAGLAAVVEHTVVEHLSSDRTVVLLVVRIQARTEPSQLLSTNCVMLESLGEGRSVAQALSSAWDTLWAATFTFEVV